MRASPNTIPPAILHPERFVRERALRYFTDSGCTDPAVMALAIEALERYGRAEAFLFPSLHELAQTEATLDWTIREFHRPWEGTAEQQWTYVRGLSRLL